MTLWCLFRLRYNYVWATAHRFGEHSPGAPSPVNPRYCRPHIWNSPSRCKSSQDLAPQPPSGNHFEFANEHFYHYGFPAHLGRRKAIMPVQERHDQPMLQRRARHTRSGGWRRGDPFPALLTTRGPRRGNHRAGRRRHLSQRPRAQGGKAGTRPTPPPPCRHDRPHPAAAGGLAGSIGGGGGWEPAGQVSPGSWQKTPGKRFQTRGPCRRDTLPQTSLGPFPCSWSARCCSCQITATEVRWTDKARRGSSRRRWWWGMYRQSQSPAGAWWAIDYFPGESNTTS